MGIKMIFKIRDSKMFEGGKPSKSHWYVKRRDRHGVYYSQITHLYYKDQRRFEDLGRGNISKHKITSFETPQGIRSKRYEPGKIGKADIVKKRVVWISKKK